MTTSDERTAPSPDAPAENPEGGVTPAGCLTGIALLVLVAGLLALAAGGFLAHVGPDKPDPDNVRCGDDIMSRGDHCIAFGGGPEDGGSYREVAEQQRGQARTHSRNHHSASVALRLGGVLVAVGVALSAVGIVAIMRDEKRHGRL